MLVNVITVHFKHFVESPLRTLAFGSEFGEIVNGRDRKVMSVKAIQKDHVERGRRGSFLAIAVDMEIVVVGDFRGPAKIRTPSLLETDQRSDRESQGAAFSCAAKWRLLEALPDGTVSRSRSGPDNANLGHIDRYQ